jgi:hypothetical protein
VSGGRRLLVVSHAGVVPVNLSVYVPLVEWGWELTIVVPDRWRHEYSTRTFRPRPLVGLEGRLLPMPILLPGRAQRHLYVARVGSVMRRLRPDVAFLEEEYFSIPAAQWGVVTAHMGVPFGVQAAENLDRPLPLPARAIRRWILQHAIRRRALACRRSPRRTVRSPRPDGARASRGSALGASEARPRSALHRWLRRSSRSRVGRQGSCRCGSSSDTRIPPPPCR